jgi:hypothetical protein
LIDNNLRCSREQQQTVAELHATQRGIWTTATWAHAPSCTYCPKCKHVSPFPDTTWHNLQVMHRGGGGCQISHIMTKIRSSCCTQECTNARACAHFHTERAGNYMDAISASVTEEPCGRVFAMRRKSLASILPLLLMSKRAKSLARCSSADLLAVYRTT